MKLDEGKSWKEVFEFAEKNGVSGQTARSWVRTHKGYKQTPEPTDIKSDILKTLSKPCKYEELQDKYKITKRVLKAILEDLQEDGYLITETEENIQLCRDIISTENIYNANWRGEKVIRFGSISDVHMCSKWQQLTFLNHAYDTYAAEGIKTVYNSGDLTEGYKMRKGHEHEVFKHGADDQAKYVVDNYPKRDGIITEFVTGNHDTSHIKNGGVDIGKMIARDRPDMKYLGKLNAVVNITPNCNIEINHPLDGSAYALSYAIQKYIDAMPGGSKPNILLNGHHHKAMYLPYRNIHAYECGAIQAQTPWMRGMRIAATVGFWIIEVHVDEDGTITRCKGEFTQLYKPIKDDY